MGSYHLLLQLKKLILGVIELQDMEGQMEFRLFGEQYLKFMHFLVPWKNI